MKRKKIFLTLLTIAALMVGQTAWAQNPTTTGDCGADGYDVNWAVTDEDNDGSYETLTISGTGVMADYDSDNQPWKLYKNDITTVVIENGVTIIGENAFNGCAALETVTIGEDVGVIRSNAFYGCPIKTLNINMKEIGDYAFNDYKSLESVSFGDNVETIGKEAFYGCSALETVTLGKGVKTIGDEAFEFCSSLTSITIPASVTSIRADAFCNCTNVTDVYCFADPDNLEWDDDDCDDFIEDKTAPNYPTKCHVLAGKLATFQAKWSKGEDTDVNVEFVGDLIIWTLSDEDQDGIEETITISGPGAMADYDNPNDQPWKDYRNYITTVIIEAGVTKIGKNAFYFCQSLGSVTIPASVTSIGECAFNECYSLTTVIFGNDSQLGTIGKAAFSDCTNLSSVTIPANVTSIGGSAFLGCENLETVTFDEDSKLTTIGEWAFCGCDLTSITIPAKVTTIEKAAFAGCKNLTTITVDGNNTAFKAKDGVLFSHDETTLVAFPCGKDSYTFPNGVTAIGDYAFCECNLLTEIEISNDIKTIGEEAFSYCEALKTVTIGDGVNSIGNHAFSYCNVLETVNIGKGVETIGNFAFDDCEKLETVTFEDGSQLTVISEGTFSGCGALESITIPAGVMAIGKQAFYESGLTSINIPASVTTIGEDAFAGCPSLTSIGVDASNNYYTNVGGVLFSKDGKTLVAYPAGKSGTSYKIPKSVTTIGESAFNGCNNLTEITLETGSELEVIGDNAFNGCENLTTIFTTLPETVTRIGEYILCNTKWYEDHSEGLLYLGNWLLGYKGDAPTGALEITEGTKGIADDAFWNCTNLTSVTIPSTVTYIGDIAFNSCENLETITITDNDNNKSNLTTIGNWAFAWSKITGIVIPASVTSIGGGAFGSCTNLESITIADGNNSFKVEDNILFSKDGTTLVTYPAGKNKTSYNIPASVTTLGGGVFGGCEALTFVTIPASVTYIGADAFYECYSVTDVYCYADPTKLTWEDNECDDFIEDDTYSNYPTKCHVLASKLDGFKAKWSTGSTGESGTDVNVEFVGDLPDIANLWNADDDHDGTTADRAYIITTTDGLDLLATEVNMGHDYEGTFFKLGNNITYSYEGLGATGRNYTPIGYFENPNNLSTNHPFSGTFDGNDKTISGIRLYPDINNPLSIFFQSLFGVIGSTGIVKNVNLDDTQITGMMGIGGIASANLGIIENCTSSALLYINDDAEKFMGLGGVASINMGTIKDCTSRATITVGKNTLRCAALGGIAGMSQFGTIENCTSYATITVGEKATYCTGLGGIAGASQNGITSNCFSFATITIGENATGCQGFGGIVGINQKEDMGMGGGLLGPTDCIIENCTSSATITFGSGATYCEGFGGIAGGNIVGTLSGNLAIDAHISNVGGAGAIVGYNENGTLANNYYSNCSVGSETTGIGTTIIVDNQGTDELVLTDIEYDNTDPNNPVKIDGAMPAPNLHIALYDSGERAQYNVTTIDNNDGNTADVHLFGRTLVKDGSWNTLCLPFALGDADAEDGKHFDGTPLEGATVMELDLADDGTYTHPTGLDGTTLYLNFKAATSIGAGRPYIVKWAKNDPSDPDLDNIVNPVFSGVTIVYNPLLKPEVTFPGGTFVGNYSPYTVKADDEIIYLGSKDAQTGNTKIGYAKADKVLRSFRAHFDMKVGILVKEINLNFDDSDEDAADAIVSPLGETEEGAGAIYNIAGQRLQKMQKGINIVNGKKILK